MNKLISFLILSLSYTIVYAECIQYYNKNGCDKLEFDLGNGMKIHQYKVIYDRDQDGVVDSLDKCLATPYKTVVDKQGCPIVAEKIVEDKIMEAVSKNEDVTTITLKVQFDTAKYYIKEVYRAEIQEFADFMIKNPLYNLKIVGHTDSINLYNKNLELSLNRANAVRDMLLKLGVDETRITTDGVASNEPVATNSTAEGRALNRRIEVSLTKNKESK